jgi:hypothetical protein
MVTSLDGSFGEAASISRGFLADHKNRPATVDTDATRNDLRVGLTEEASRSRSDSNMTLALSYFPV